VDIGAPLVAEAEAAVLMKPGERALDDPSLASEPGAVPRPLMSDDRPDLAGAQPGLGGLRVIAAVTEQ